MKRKSRKVRKATNALLVVFCTAVKTTARKNRISQAEIARRVGAAQANVSQMLSGKRNLTLKSMTALANAVGLVCQIRILPREYDSLPQPTEEQPR